MKAAPRASNAAPRLHDADAAITNRGIESPQVPPTDQSPDTLLVRLRTGDEAASEMLVRDYGGRMLAVARRLLRREEDAQDVVQEAFLQAFRAIDRFRGESNLSTWLHRIVTNAAFMKLRASSRRPEVTIEELLPRFDETGHHAKPVQDWSPAARLVSEENCSQVRACIARLPAPYREILVLRDIEGLDTDATAAMLGITPGSVKTRLHRARQALRTLLEPLFVT